MKLNRKGFTLVEMLIVIVIIGILAAAILPSLMGARDKANDTARISSVNQLNTAIVSYSHTSGNYPAVCSGATALLSTNGNAYTANDARTFKNQIEKIPTDPNGNNSFSLNNNTVKGEYGYCGIEKGGNKNSAYIVVAKVSDPANANYIASGNDVISSANTASQDYNKFKDLICDSVKIGDTTKVASATDKNCTVREGEEGSLRYVLLKS